LQKIKEGIKGALDRRNKQEIKDNEDIKRFHIPLKELDESKLTPEAKEQIEDLKQQIMKEASQEAEQKSMDLDGLFNEDADNKKDEAFEPLENQTPQQVVEQNIPKPSVSPPAEENSETNTVPPEPLRDFHSDKSCFLLKEDFYKYFTKKILPHLEPRVQWFFYSNLFRGKKSELCLCQSLNEIYRLRGGEAKIIYREPKLGKEDLKDGNADEYRRLALERKVQLENQTNDFNRQLREVNKKLKAQDDMLKRKSNENNKLMRALLLFKERQKKETEEISKIFIEHKLEKNDEEEIIN
jgi:hypothetical protein